MITVDISDWAAVASIIVATATLLGVLTTKIDKVDAKLSARIEQARQEAKADNKATRDELGTRITEVRSELTDIRASLRAIEQRFFELLLPRRPLSTGTDDS